MSLKRKKKYSVERRKGEFTETYDGDALVTDIRQCVFGVPSGSYEKIGWILGVQLEPYANVEAFAGPRGLYLGHLRHSDGWVGGGKKESSV